jgi:hypothetical protein
MAAFVCVFVTKHPCRNGEDVAWVVFCLLLCLLPPALALAMAAGDSPRRERTRPNGFRKTHRNIPTLAIYAPMTCCTLYPYNESYHIVDRPDYTEGALDVVFQKLSSVFEFIHARASRTLSIDGTKNPKYLLSIDGTKIPPR